MRTTSDWLATFGEINPDLSPSERGSGYGLATDSRLYTEILHGAVAHEIEEGYVMTTSFGPQPVYVNRSFPIAEASKGIPAQTMELRASGTEWYAGTTILTEAPAPGKRGKGTQVGWIPSLIVDIDTSDGVHKEQNTPSLEEALEVIKTCPIPWTMIVHSGGGLHLYCCLQKPMDIRTPEGLAAAKQVMGAWKNWWDKAFEKVGRVVDAGVIGDYTRVLRQVGSLNCKRGREDVTLFAARPEVQTAAEVVLERMPWEGGKKAAAVQREIEVRTHMARQFSTVTPGTIEWLKAKPGDRLNSLVAIGPLVETMGLGTTSGDVEGTGRWTFVDGDQGHPDHAQTYEGEDEGVQTMTIFDTALWEPWGIDSVQNRQTAWTAVASLGYNGNYKAAARAVGDMLRELVDEGRTSEAVTETASLIHRAQQMRAALETKEN